ncbi:MAG: hypothetical protein A2579_00835 [Lysobacterales bacterium RIFOXYD1_FULL_69_11]|nr:MAG: hypothetical protein A2579_00835 [Xanthomonadales bacterium RIFOXYD1_FULL_69_11]
MKVADEAHDEAPMPAPPPKSEPPAVAGTAPAGIRPAVEAKRPPLQPAIVPTQEARVAPPPPTAPSAGLRTLHRALLRAAGQRTARAAEAVLQELGVDTAAVQGDAAAKRALWVRLRARRRQSRQ